MSTTTASQIQPSFFTRFSNSLSRKIQHWLDRSVTHPIIRWLLLVVIYSLYGLRVYYLQGFYIITYGLGIYCLNLFIGFLSPRDEMQLQEGPVLPNKQNEEFKPFSRRLPEFHFWKSACRAALFATAATFFPVLDIPVFWPILLIYFIILFFLTMKRQIKHMIKFKYLPFSFGKKTYKPDESITKKKPTPLPRIDRPKVRAFPGSNVTRVHRREQ